MSVLEIVTYPHSILLSEAQAVNRITRRARRLARDMLETMSAVSGVGLAAPQVGVRQRVIVVDVFLDKPVEPDTLVATIKEVLGEHRQEPEYPL